MVQIEPVTLQVVTVDPVIATIAILFGTIWTLINCYLFYPLVQAGVERLVATLRRDATAGNDGGRDRPPTDELTDGGRPRDTVRPGESENDPGATIFDGTDGDDSRGTVFGGTASDGSAGDEGGDLRKTERDDGSVDSGETVFVGEPVESEPPAESSLPEDDPPSIDVLLPAYDEPEVVGDAIESILAADYPEERFRLTVLIEPGDLATWAAVDPLQDDDEFEILTVPTEYPGDPNKPRALNYGFEHTDGDVVGVIDAEDVVEEGLFHEVAATVRDGADYMQGRLDMANEGDGWLNLQFRAEYGHWYNVVTPAFERVDYPVPMAGTTCFFRRDVLEDISEERIDLRGDPWDEDDWAWARSEDLSGVRPWDPENVTEDFEVGLFLWTQGYEFAYLESVTAEESPQTLDGWLRQRTRWKKGKIYTFFDFLSDPVGTRRQRAHVYWQSLLPHLGPVNIAGVVMVFMMANLLQYRPSLVVEGVLSLGLTFATVTAGLVTTGYWTASDAPLDRRIRRSAVVTVTLPLYWLAQWGADLRALYLVYGGDLHWEHTDHEGRIGRSETVVDPGALDRFARRLTLPRLQRWAALGTVVGIGAVARVYRLGDWSLWTDELYSVVVRGDQPVAQLLISPRDPHPPLYYLLLHGWMALFGNGAFAVRLLSVLASLAAIVGVYLLAAELFDDRTGLFAALLFSVSAFHVHFARVARMYALVAALTAFSWYFYARLRDGTRESTAGYVLLTAALVYTHVYGLFVLLAQHVYRLLSERSAGVSGERWRRVQAVLGALIAPWLAVFAVRVLGLLFGGAGANIEWIPEPSAVLLTQTVLSFVGYPDLYPIGGSGTATYVLASALVFVYGGQLLVSCVKVESDTLQIEDFERIGQLVALLAVPTFVPFLISYVVPIYVPRYSMPASVAFVVLAARGLRNVPRKKIRFGLLAAVVASSLLLVGIYHAGDTAEPWDRVASDVKSDLEPNDIVIHQPGNGYDEYYYSDTEATLATLPSGSRLSTGDLEYLRKVSRTHGTVYLVQYYGWEGPAVEYLTACHPSVTVRQYGVVTLYQFDGEESCPPPDEFEGGGERTKSDVEASLDVGRTATVGRPA